MQSKPSPKQLVDATGISPSYASMILGSKRSPTRALAIKIFRELGWRHPVIEGLSNADMKTLERIEPWASPSDRQAA